MTTIDFNSELERRIEQHVMGRLTTELRPYVLHKCNNVNLSDGLFQNSWIRSESSCY